MKKSLDRLPTRAEDDCVNVIVESPRGSRLKFEFDPKLATFTVARPLPLGMSYPFDWASSQAREVPTAIRSTQ